MALDSLAPYRQRILDAAARRGARNVRVFGSVARGDDRPNSDIDLLVDVEPGRTLLDVIALEQDLQELLGRRVEVLTDGGLSPYLQQRILAEATSL
jgi:predicted nucleotidyltransferase